jgi:formylglycine-generating enzyme required for sulfatase activity
MLVLRYIWSSPKHKTMKNIILSLLALSVVQAISAQNLKQIHKQFKAVNNALYASQTEVSNAEYNAFLLDLQKENRKEEFQKAQIDSNNWIASFPQAYNEPYATYYHRHPAYANYPVVNLSHESATLYCAWLTQKYMEQQKRKFNKVVFRLPSKEEWQMAARGGNPDASYPWKGDEHKNAKGQWQCNFKSPDPQKLGIAGTSSDNADILAPCESYWPNAFGLYNLLGNTAEMLSTQGEMIGGSWKDSIEMMHIAHSYVSQMEHESSPFVGFRVFMEVLE